MLDLKNDINSLSVTISAAKKADRASIVSKNKTKIKTYHAELNAVNENFNQGCKKYRIALQECGSLKSEYKHTVSELCKEFKALFFL